MSALTVNFKISDLQDLLDEIDGHTVVMKDEDKEDQEYIKIDDLKTLLETYIEFNLIDLDKI